MSESIFLSAVCSRFEVNSNRNSAHGKRCAEEGISGGEDGGHEASPEFVLGDENRAEGSTPANRPMGAPPSRACMRTLSHVDLQGTRVRTAV